ncbi:DNA sulfur modification protein DndB [Phormidium sp. CCY1219]|uniref:DNA sulfur modification protein DndB n=1 Tax=Phormidium sp. CCY1219 TaxID=2886104 RepID=UPI002D1EB8B5|nr:DNA sulfur modification protein DndB [Phormidium sp. CCY1219]MEB3827551.1 DNA sulfur modification protein DndB [Phormidium sp. CCY1219]
MVSPAFEYVLPVIRGIQAGREYYVSMCPLQLLPKLLPLDEEEHLPETVSRRALNPSRAAQIARYILNNPASYTLSAIAVSIDADITFEPMGSEADKRKMGRLHVPIDARFIINDGEHRRAALKLASEQNPELGYETIAVIFFLDIGVQHLQQMFRDLNQYALRPDPCLNLLYNHRDESAILVKAVCDRVEVFRALTETERSTLPTTSGKLFTLNNLYHATAILLENHRDEALEGQIQRAVDFSTALSAHIPDWQRVRERQMSAREMRRDYVHTHPIALRAISPCGCPIAGDRPGKLGQSSPGFAKNPVVAFQ